jgi:hypothetical protein
MPHYDELYPGRFLKGSTLEHPITIRILSLGGEVLEGDDGEKAKGVLKYRTAGPNGPVNGEIVWAKTNAILTAKALGTDDYTAWAGHTITIANDPSIMFGKEKVGGIRVVGSPELKLTLIVDVKRPRRKKPERYTLRPTDAQGRVRQGTGPTPPEEPDWGVPGPPTEEREPGAEG